MPIEGTERFRATGTYVYRRVAGETILVPVRRTARSIDSILVLRGSADRIWQMIEEGLSFSQTKDNLATGFDRSHDSVEKDLRAFLEQLLETEAIRFENGEPPVDG